VWATAGGSPDHAGIAANIARVLGNQLVGRRCRVFSSDLRVRVKATGLATYPDVTVVCGQLEIDPDDPKHHTVTNPKVLVEVLSPSTESYDRGEKLDHYRQIVSLEMVLLVAHDARRVDVWRRTDTEWIHHVAEGGTVAVDPIECQLPVTEIYRDPLA
jgi:Uma2 family endonuclease